MQKVKYFILFAVVVMAIQFSGCTTNEGEIIDSSVSHKSGDEKNKLINLVDDQAINLKISDMEYGNLNLKLNEYVIDLEENATINTYCIAGGKIYYAIDYIGYYENCMQMSGERLAFNKAHNTRIMVYDILSDESTVLYQYNEEWCVETTDMQCNGRYLVWEDYCVEGEGWSIKCCDISSLDLEEPKNVAVGSAENGQLSTVTLTITDDYLYWYNREIKENGELGRCSLYRYDFTGKEVEAVKAVVDTNSPYERVTSIGGVLATYRYYDEMQSEVIIEKDEVEINKIYIDHYVKDVQCNGDTCAWINDANRKYLNVYSINNDKYIKIDCEYIFSYALYENLLVVNQNNGIYVYNVIENTYHVLQESDGTYCLYTFLGVDGVYAQVYENSFIHIK